MLLFAKEKWFIHTRAHTIFMFCMHSISIMQQMQGQEIGEEKS